MSDHSFSAMLRELSKNYYQSHLGFEEYRSQRKLVLDRIDEEFNGRKADEEDVSDAQVEEALETSKDASIFMKTIAFFKNSDIQE